MTPPDSPATEAPPNWTGTLTRVDPTTIRGEIRDRWFWVIDLVVTRLPDGTYRAEGFLGETPDALRLPGESLMREPLTEV